MDSQRLAVAVLTYNRKDMLVKTLTSLYSDEAAEIFVFDNGSLDGSAELVKSIDGKVNTGTNHTTGHGMNRVIDMALGTNPDIILFSADDFVYCEGYTAKILEFWKHAPKDIKLASCYLEPVWPWNEVLETGDAGSVHYVIRTTIPGSNWMFRAKDKDLILPISEKTGGEDIEICNRLTSQGYKLAALDLVDHIGERDSAWGNQSWKYAVEIDREGLGFK